jgi:hypothetical protein
MLLVFLCTLACNEDEIFIDPFPIAMDMSAGPAVIGASFRDREPPVPVVLDTMSPITLFEPPEGGLTKRTLRSITLFGRQAGQIGVPRARFPKTPSFETRVCAEPIGGCVVGTPGTTTTIFGVIGSDVIGRGAARFDFATQRLTLFPYIPGSDIELTRACDAVFPRPFAGGGTLHVGDEDIRFVGIRPTVSACLDATNAPATELRGVDAFFVVSTALGPSLMAASAYDRYATALAAPPRNTLPAGQVFLPSGPIAVQVGQIGQFALVGEESHQSNQRGPCQELYANRIMSYDLCSQKPEAVAQCPCEDNDLFCRTGAAVVIREPLNVLVIPDEEPFLQALREELRPLHPDVDGILGTQALNLLRVEFDYPGNRLLMRCNDPTRCLIRPQVRAYRELPAVQRCLAGSTLQ